MIESVIKTIPGNGKEVQRVQCVSLDGWDELDFFRPAYSEAAFGRICTLFRSFVVPRAPWIFGSMVFFHLPDDMDLPFPFSTRYGEVCDRHTAAVIGLKEGVKIVGGKPVFLNKTAKAFWRELEERGCVQVICGRLPHTKIMPVGNGLGLLTESEPEARVKVNSSFFIMDCFDCRSVYDTVGTAFGMCVKDGLVLSPPLFEREALFVRRDGSVSITTPRLEDFAVTIGDNTFRHGENAEYFSRPQRIRTPAARGYDYVIIGNRVAAVHRGGRCPVPAAGFVLKTCFDAGIHAGDAVSYPGHENIAFGIQVGNSIIRDGEPVTDFVSTFYNIRKPFSIEYPPSLYPLDYEKARAPRIALGEGEDGRPVLLWVEGMGKFGYEPGKEGCGASLLEMTEICSLLGLRNAVNLDGGGSAQILLNNARSLKVSDRNSGDLSEIERAVPMGLIVR